MDTVRKWLVRFVERPYIRLPLTVVVLSSTKDNDFINETLKQALEASAAFWLELGIKLQVVVRGWQEVPNPLDMLEDKLHDLHRWTLGAPLPTVYVFSDARFLEGGDPALTWVHNGIAAIAGDGLGDINLNEWIDHELGHLLGLDHEDGTFMRATMELHNRVVTPAQCAVVLRNAYNMGGF